MTKYNVPAVEKALRMIELLGEAQSPVRITDISTTLDISKSTVLMTLSTLERNGYAEKTEDGRYKLTMKFATIGVSDTNLKRVAHSSLEELAEELKYTVHLSTLRGHENVLLDKVSGPGFIQFQTFEGKCQPIHATSSGKVLLAFSSPEKRNEILENCQLTRFTPNTITTISALKTELEKIRACGYAVEDQEEEIGVRCVGAPIFNASGQVVGAVSVTAICSELEPPSIPDVARRIQAGAGDISRRLGYDLRFRT